MKAKSAKRKFLNRAINHFLCLFCMQTISHDKTNTDAKGRPIALDYKGEKRHDCPILLDQRGV